MTSATKEWGAPEIQRFLADYTADERERHRPEYFRVHLAPPDEQAGFRVFRAEYGGSERETGISGVLIGSEPPEVRLYPAIAKVFDRCLAAGPSVAMPVRLAAAVEVLIDPMDRGDAILTEGDIARVEPAAWRTLIHLPAAAEGGVERGIRYCRVSGSGATEYLVERDARGEILTDERRLDR